MAHLIRGPRTPPRTVTSQKSSYDEAIKSKTTHRFIPKYGYRKYSAEPLAYTRVPGLVQSCMPKVGTRDGSSHFLKPPGQNSMAFRWIEKEQAWERPGGKRLAFTAEYLAHFGWRYVSPCLQ